MSIDDKLDKLLVEITSLRSVTEQHTKELVEIKGQMAPLMFQYSGIKWMLRVGGGIMLFVAFMGKVKDLFKS